jgi:hypothetical protein
VVMFTAASPWRHREAHRHLYLRDLASGWFAFASPNSSAALKGGATFARDS